MLLGANKGKIRPKVYWQIIMNEKHIVFADIFIRIVKRKNRNLSRFKTKSPKNRQNFINGKLYLKL